MSNDFVDNPDFDKYAEGDLVYVLWESGQNYEDDGDDDEVPGIIHHVDSTDSTLPWAVSRCVSEEDDTTVDYGDWGWYSDNQIRPRKVREFIIHEELDLVD